MTANGQMLWHIQGNEPTLGTHPFQPAFFGSTLFAIESALNGVVASYDLQSGAVLWTQKLDDTLEYAAPFLLFGKMLYIAADHTLYALDRTDGTLLWKADRPTRILSPMRLLLIVLAGLSVLCLLLLWMLPFKLMQDLWHSSRTTFALLLLPVPCLGGVLLYGQLASSQNYLNHIATSSGSIQWQNSTSTPVQLAMADPQGSIVIKSAGKFMHHLAALSPDGTPQWTSFASEGGFSLPTVSTQPGTVLVALSGRTSPQYHFAMIPPIRIH